LELQAGQGIQVTGPTKMQVIQGTLSLFGALISSDQDIIIQAGKHLPFEVEEDAQIELVGAKLEYHIVDTPLIPADRKGLAKTIESLPHPVKIMILGQIDTGKTSVVCYLANHFFNLGKKVAVIDLDMGQQDIGPPTTIALGILNKSILQLGDIPLTRMVFVGKTSPKGRLVQTITGARELVDHALFNNADIILIDTTGWVFGGAARAFKSAKIRNLKPELLVALQKENEISHILEPFESSVYPNIINLSVFPNIHIRNQTTRKFLRESKFNQYFSTASSRLFNLNYLKIENSFFKSGAPLKMDLQKNIEQILGCDFIYTEKAVDALFLVKKPSAMYEKNKLHIVKEQFKVSDIRIVSKNEEAGLVVGLLDKNLNTMGIGLIESINYEENKIRIFTPVTKQIKVLQFGILKISKTGQELAELKSTF
ncbi:MAG: Clp1/GlmU family protein, partial [Promethearchaeota archaeon]